MWARTSSWGLMLWIARDEGRVKEKEGEMERWNKSRKGDHS